MGFCTGLPDGSTLFRFEEGASKRAAEQAETMREPPPVTPKEPSSASSKQLQQPEEEADVVQGQRNSATTKSDGADTVDKQGNAALPSLASLAPDELEHMKVGLQKDSTIYGFLLQVLTSFPSME